MRLLLKEQAFLNGVRSRKRGKRERHGHFHKLLGVAIALMGFFWFANKAGWIPAEDGGSPLFWPAVTMAVGVGIIFLAGKRRELPKGE